MQSGKIHSPKRPILDWSSLFGSHGSKTNLPSIAELPYRQPLTSGRAAIYHAIKLISSPSGSGVLVPTYHCPTMIAPIINLGLEPVFYPINENGQPALDRIPDSTIKNCHTIIAPHYFGITRSFSELRNWCDDKNIKLIEDCAHAFYGKAGERPVGHWGDYATASMTKFFPIFEGGILGSAYHKIPEILLKHQSKISEMKAVYDIIHLATSHKRMTGFGPIISTLQNIKEFHKKKHEQRIIHKHQLIHEGDIEKIDLERLDLCQLKSSSWIFSHFPQHPACERRKSIFEIYKKNLKKTKNTHPLYPEVDSENLAPYAFPLWVDNADHVYQLLRGVGAPVFRWDRLWPGTPVIPGDQGYLWSHHVLQLLCHQSLTDAEVNRSIEIIDSNC
jgi:dTDP-4-amino-4,6-dideoxygalactose transaminase